MKPKPKYRLLRNGEIIREGDEYKTAFNGWKIETKPSQMSYAGRPWNRDTIVPYRREVKPKKKKAVKPDLWTYSPYRAMLRKNGETFAIVTPDGRDSLSRSAAKELLSLLNKGRK